MKSADERFREALIMSQGSEHIVALAYQPLGWGITHLSRIEVDQQWRRGPRMHGASPKQAVILPDLLASKEGRTCAIEVKGKRDQARHRKTGEWRHGIDRYLWDHYCEWQDQTGIPLLIAFVETVGGAIRVQRLNRLAECLRASEPGSDMSGYGNKEMVYFPVDKMTEIGYFKTPWDIPNHYWTR